MPGRAIGVQWFSIDRTARTLAVDMDLPPVLRPNSTLAVPVKVGGPAAGEEARVVVAAVDVGILNLTNYKPPAPDDYYLGQRRLTAEIRDLYGQLIDGMQGTRGQDQDRRRYGAAELPGSPPTQTPLALYSGIVTVGRDGTAEVAFDIPDFAGTVRVMAVAWSKDKVGNAAGDVIVRDPVVLTATLPRFLLTGDRGTMHLDLDNVEGAGRRLQHRGRRRRHGQARCRKPQTLKLAAKQRDHMAGAAQPPRQRRQARSMSASPGPAALRCSAATRSTCGRRRRSSRAARAPLAKGERLTLSNDVFADLVPGTGRVALSVAVSTALDAATLLKALDRYPFGCSEQITSRAMPLLYVNELAGQAHLALDGDIDQRIRDAIERLLARQGSNGSFGLWSVGGDDAWLDAYVTDFLTRARERNFEVPAAGFTLALDRLRNFVARAPDAEQGRRPRSRLCALCAGAQRRGARSAICAISPTPSSPTSPRRSPRRRSPPRWHARRRARADRLTPPRSTPSRRSPSSTSAAPTTARRCATRPRW